MLIYRNNGWVSTRAKRRHTKQILTKKYKILLLLVILIWSVLFSYYYFNCKDVVIEEKESVGDFTNREELLRYIYDSIEETLKEDKGTGCDMPKLDPFDKESMQLDKAVEPIQCPAEKSWVTCYKSNCRIIYDNVECIFRDIIYVNDDKQTLGPANFVASGEQFTFIKSDHVKIHCEPKAYSVTTEVESSFSGMFGKKIIFKKKTKTWEGHVVGFRKHIRPIRPPAGRERTINVMILMFDSTSKNGFIRKMPKSYKVLTEELGATILNSYNVVGDGTNAALLPILTGKTELELPEVRRSAKNTNHTDVLPLLFYKLKKDGYRTAYFENSAQIGTFQFRYNGFLQQPTDHYLMAFSMEVDEAQKFHPSPMMKYCVGDIPSFQLMLNISEQFLQFEGKKFALTFIVDITHEDFNFIVWSDEATAEFLQRFKRDGYVKDTLLLVMGDHGPRYSAARSTVQGKLEERLPLVSIRLPDKLRQSRPEAQLALESNAEVLTTPHDIYATLLDALDMTEHWNPFKVKGADLPRAMTLLRPIPKNRSCSEAGIQPHWCACVNWDYVAEYNPMYKRAAEAIVDHINLQTESLRSKCALLKLKTIHSVTQRRINPEILAFKGANYDENAFGRYADNITLSRNIYQVKIEVSPGSGLFEATVVHVIKEDIVVVNNKEISRINRYGNDPNCISAKYPHLNMFCYCLK